MAGERLARARVRSDGVSHFLDEQLPARDTHQSCHHPDQYTCTTPTPARVTGDSGRAGSGRTGRGQRSRHRYGSPARTRYRAVERIRVAQVAPSHAPARLPARRLTTTDQRGVRAASGGAVTRAGSAMVTTGRLISLFKMIACNAAKPNMPQQRQAELGSP